MQTLEYIDNYFRGALSADEAGQFEQRILTDLAFAEEASFYCNALQAARDASIMEKKARFREIYANKATAARPGIVRTMMRLSAAAAILLAIFAGWYIFRPQSSSPDQLSKSYIEKNLKTVETSMSSETGGIQTGKRLYNEGELTGALQHFEAVTRTDPASAEAKKLAGIVSLRTEQYDKALQYFKQLGNITQYANPAKFYQALTLMKRNRPGDKLEAKRLLQEVVDQKLEGHQTAREWLDSW
jgi:tetratricopeptide (TPR) repeat protein